MYTEHKSRQNISEGSEMSNELDANKALAASVIKVSDNKELLNERKPLDFTDKESKLGDVNDSSTWSVL